MRLRTIIQGIVACGIAVVAALPHGSAAATCGEQSGQCMTIGDCSHLVQLYPFENELVPYAADIGKQDCQGAFVTCCKLKDVTPPPPPPESTSQCQQQNGRCMSTSLCNIYQAEDPSISSTPADCDPENTGEDICCIGVPLTSQGSCTAPEVGGACKPSCEAGDEPMGQYDCTAGTTCCRVKTSAPATGGAAAGAGGQGTFVAAPPGTLFETIQSVNPSTLACIKTGNCSVDDIVFTGVAFAQFLMGLSGALFFIIFIYGGALYLTSFGNKSQVDKGKKAIIGAAIGIIIVMGAWTIVRYIVGGITGIAVTGGSASAPTPGQTGTPNDCTTVFPGYSCKSFPNAVGSADLLAKCQQAGNDCKPGHCSGAKDMCAKSP